MDSKRGPRPEARKTVSDEDDQCQLIHLARLAELGAVAASVGHEMRDALNKVDLNAGLITMMADEKTINRDGVRQAAKVIAEMTARLSQVIHSVTRLARDDESDAPEEVRVADLMGDTLALLNEKIKCQKITLRVDEIDPELTLTCKQILLSQAVINLVNNAIDATEGRKNPSIQVGIRDLGECVEISVTDNGVGLPPKARDRLFEKFFTTKGPGKGTGMGSFLCRRIVESHGGQCFLDDDSRDTRFVIRLPKAPRASKGEYSRSA